MMFNATKREVLNRGRPPDAFLREMVEWARGASGDIFAPNPIMDWRDIYNKVKPELWHGLWPDLLTRKAAMLEVMRVLAGFESSWDWTEGVDTSRLGADTPSNSEAGAWQMSYDARFGAPDVRKLLVDNRIMDGITFQRSMKFNHPLAMECVARLLRINTRHHGPLYKTYERLAIRKSLRGEEQSIYPWLSTDAMDEFKVLLA